MCWAEMLGYIKVFLLVANVYGFMLVRRKMLTEQPPASSARRRVLFVIAHPDDEAMFFVPTITQLKGRHELFLLCLSNGGADGLGQTRGRELMASTKLLGFDSSSVTLVDHPELKDGMRQVWDASVIAHIVDEHSKKQEIDRIITFDEGGVSGHPNHVATFQGVRRMLMQRRQSRQSSEPRETHESQSECPKSETRESQSECLKRRAPGQALGPPAATTTTTAKRTQARPDAQLEASCVGLKLISTSLIRKYLGPLDAVVSAFNSNVYFHFSLATSLHSMQAHQSQLVWYRRLFIVFSRYSYMNTYDIIDVID